MPNALHRPQYEVFRSLLVEAREKASLTQADVAEKLAKPQSFISKYERGERRLDFTEFIDIADILGINVGQFVKRYRNRTAS